MEIFHTLSQVLNVKLEPNPLVQFGVTGGKIQLTAEKQCTSFFGSFLARRAILLRWKDAATPTHTQWFRDLMSSDSIVNLIQHSNGKLQEAWVAFLSPCECLVIMCSLNTLHTTRPFTASLCCGKISHCVACWQ